MRVARFRAFMSFKIVSCMYVQVRCCHRPFLLVQYLGLIEFCMASVLVSVAVLTRQIKSLIRRVLWLLSTNSYVYRLEVTRQALSLTTHYVLIEAVVIAGFSYLRLE